MPHAGNLAAECVTTILDFTRNAEIIFATTKTGEVYAVPALFVAAQQSDVFNSDCHRKRATGPRQTQLRHVARVKVDISIVGVIARARAIITVADVTKRTRVAATKRHFRASLPTSPRLRSYKILIPELQTSARNTILAPTVPTAVSVLPMTSTRRVL